MKQVAALVLVAILGRFVEGAIFTKCELKSELDDHMTSVQTSTKEKVVCGVEHSSGSDYDSSATSTKTVGTETWTLYGIFQISHHYCGGGPGACESSCSLFTDDDIEDDIDCIEQIRSDYLANPSGAGTVLQTNFQQIFRAGCDNTFANCSATS